MKGNDNHSVNRKRVNNNFDLLRLLAAFCVLLSHSYGILGKGLQQPYLTIGNMVIMPSDIGLYIFFTISGYLVTQSLFTSGSYLHYLWKRFVRIVPALTVVNLFCVVMGAFVSTLPAKEYFAGSSAWSYLIVNTTLIHSQPFLPGVFTSLRDRIVNASAWTLLIEVRFYIVLMIVNMMTLLKRKWLLLFAFIVFAIATVYFITTPSKILSFDPAIYLLFGTYFFLGVLYRCFETYISFSWQYASLLFLVAALTLTTSIQFVTIAVFISYIIIATGNTKAVIHMKGWDISYGFYLYAFPVQQLLLLAFGYSVNVWLHILLSTLLTSIIALLSWRYVEQPALKKKDAFIANKAKQRMA